MLQLTWIHLIILVETIRADVDRLPYILSFAEDPKGRDKNQAFVRREASNKDGFSHYALRALSRATFVDAHDITNYRPFESINEVTNFYDERSHFAQVRDRELAFGPDEVRILRLPYTVYFPVRVSTDESYEYDPDFYDAIAAQTFAERRRAEATVTHSPHVTPRHTTTVPTTTTVPDVSTMTYASIPLQGLFARKFLPPQPPPVYTTPLRFRIFTTTTARPSTVLPHTTPSTTSTTLAPTTVITTHATTVSSVLPTTSSPTTVTTPPSTVPPAAEPQTLDRPSTVSIDSEVTPLLLLKPTANHGVESQNDSPFFRADIVNRPRRYCRDVIFVLDNSGSTKFNFERLKLLIENLADLVFEDSARKVGVITFSSRHRQRVVNDWSHPRPLDAPKDLHRKLRDLTFAGGITQLGAALSMLQDRLFDENLRQVVRPVDIVLFTDGYSYDDPSGIARSLRLHGHRIYVAALFSNYLRSELDSITGDPARVYTEMEGLDTLAHSLHSCL